jgi:uncharacterized protein YbjT (DUF2867 family)
MKIILFGATGMVGQGVLRECLLDSSRGAEIHDHDRTSRPRHDQGGEERLSEAVA